MIIQNQTRSVENNAGQTKAFGMVINSHAFDLVINKLYTRPIDTIVQELVSNAWDAHQTANALRNIEVTAPTSLTPSLIVKDYGTGLSEEDIENVYTKVFVSTKQSDNNTLGGYGLGCKSPYAYTDTFTVESRFNGIRSFYTMFKDATGLPCYTKMGEATTDEHAGLTITIPIKHDDLSKFWVALERLCFFDNVSINSAYVDCNVTCLMKTATGGFYKLPVDNGLYIKINSVLYRIDIHNLALGSTYTYSWGCSIVLDARIGEFPITPSKETIIINEVSLKQIRTKLERFKDEFLENIQRLIDAFPSYETACTELRDLYKTTKALSWWKAFAYQERRIDTTVTITIPNSQIHALTPNRRRTGFRHVEVNCMTVFVDHHLEIYWLPLRATRAQERLAIEATLDGAQKYLIRADDLEDVKQRLNWLGHLVKFFDLSKTNLPKQKRHTTKSLYIKSLYSNITTTIGQCDYYIDKTAIPLITNNLHDVLYWYNQHTHSCIADIFLLNKTQTKYAKKQGARNFLDILKPTVLACAQLKQDLLRTSIPLSITNFANPVFAKYLEAYPNPTIKALHDFAIDYQIFLNTKGTLCTLLTLFDIPFPAPSTTPTPLFEAAEKYTWIVDNNIHHTASLNLLHTIITHLEQN